MDDSELVTRTRRGDHDAFARLVRRHQGIGHRVAYLVLRDEVEAEDVVQEAFVKAHRALGGFREGDSEAKEELLAAIGELREDERLVISYRYLLEMSEAETAATLSCPPGTVKSRLSRAMARLRESLVEGGTRA